MSIPFAAISNTQAEKLLGIHVKRKKEYTTDITFLSHDLPSLINYAIDSKGTSMIMKEAILDAITSPYLRGVVVCFFANDRTFIQIAQVRQNPFTKLELLGVIISCYEEMSQHSHSKFTISFQERKETHMIEGSGFSQFLMDRTNSIGKCEVLIVNVHHDYMKGYSNIQDERLLLNLFREVENTNYAVFSKRA